MIFNIQRFSIHDGPGIRTVVFLKGCPLRCLWCSNPESQAAAPEILFYGDKCVGCLKCLAVCPAGARHEADGRLAIDRRLCRACGRCAQICPNSAVRAAGGPMTIEEVLRLVEQDRPFYDESGGGVTLSGGEPAAQADFSAAILARCEEKLIATAVETTGASPWPDLQKVIAHADLVLYDLKHAEAEKHRRLTGAGNGLILENAREVARSGKELIVRIPVIPGVNDDRGCMEALASFVRELEVVKEVDLLPYHEYGRAKYGRLGRAYPLPECRGLEPDDEQMVRARRIFTAAGFIVQVGG